MARWWRNWIERLRLRSGRDERVDFQDLLVDLVMEAGRHRDPTFLPGLDLALGHRDDGVARSAAELFEALLLEAPSERLVELDEEQRRTVYFDAHHRGDLERLVRHRERRLRLPDPPTGLLLAEAMVGDGRRREAALARLAPGRGRAALALLLLRLDDWVPQVRAQAEASLRAYGHIEIGSLLAGLLPLTLRLAGRARAGASYAMRGLVERLEDDPPRAELGALVTRPRPAMDTGLRLSLARLLIDAPTDDPALGARALEVCIGSPHLAVAMEAARRALAATDPAERLGHARRLWRSPLGPLRRLALGALVGLVPDADELTELLDEGLFDATEGVRRLARHHALERGTLTRIELAARCREVAFRAGPSRRRRAAVVALGLHGDDSDVAPLTTLARDPAGGRLAAVAVTALARRAGASSRDDLVACLAAPAPSVSRAAARALSEQARDRAALEPAELHELTEPGRPAHVRRAAIGLAASLDKWTHLGAILSGAEGPHPLDAAFVETALELWERSYNRRWTDPGDMELARLRARLEMSAQHLQPQRLVRLRNLLDDVARRMRRA